MKKIICALVLIFMIFPSKSISFAVEEGKVVSDSQKQQELMESFGEVNRYTNGFFRNLQRSQRYKKERSDHKLHYREQSSR